MVAKLVGVAAVINLIIASQHFRMNILKFIFLISLFFSPFVSYTQQDQDTSIVYKKRVLETTEFDIISSYYGQNGDNAAVSGGIGTEELTDLTSTLIVSIPLNDDDILTIDAGISAYTSASSSNINPYDVRTADAFQASTGASSSDVWAGFTGSYSHSSDDRNTIWSAKASLSTEFDYSSMGVGGAFTQLFNEKNTELSINANVFIDTWTTIYPYELRSFTANGNGLNNSLFKKNTIKGNTNYNPTFNEFDNKGRNSFSLGFGFSQILHKNLQGSLALDFVQQQGLLSTPFQRVYFGDIENSYIENFQLADANEKLPNSRFKIAIGERLNWFINEEIVLRSFYRYYSDDWGISSHTASIEIPIKIMDQYTLYPSFRFYNQTAADYFRPYEGALSTDQYYTSDYDLSTFSSNQYGLGVSYTDIFAESHIWIWGLKSIDLKFYKYNRNSTFSSYIITGGVKFLMD